MYKNAFLKVMSVICFLYGLAAVISFLSAFLMSLVASIADNFFSALMPFGPKLLQNYFMFFFCILLGGVLLIITAAAGIRAATGKGEFDMCMVCAAMAAVAHVGVMYLEVPSVALSIAAMVLGIAIPLLFMLSAAVAIRLSHRV
ncbi:MAG: hypothetical protein IKG08_10220 [Eubacterium sp.]|nr:hypothetical protein [Eubacterium sp.]MBR3276960.1 hypothetical protein [Eubacterium sp.]